VGTRSFLNFEGSWEIETAYGDVWELVYPGGFLNRIAGVGIPQATYAAQKAPGQHGETHLGYVLNSRTVQMGFDLDGGSGNQECLVQVREDKPFAHLNYLVNPLIIRRRLPSKVRELWNVWYVAGMERDSGSVTVPPTIEGLAMQFNVKDPVWYDPNIHSYDVELADLASGDELVFDTPGGVVGPTSIFGTADYLTFGLSSLLVTLTAGEITTLGDWYTFPQVVVDGPAVGFEIENLSSSQEITLDYSIAAGETVTFDLRYGYKTVTNGAGTNLAGYVPSTDDLADFCLWPHPLATDGENDIRIFCGNAAATTMVTVTWYDRYLAV